MVDHGGRSLDQLAIGDNGRKRHPFERGTYCDAGASL
jgi:hypothetical protein